MTALLPGPFVLITATIFITGFIRFGGIQEYHPAPSALKSVDILGNSNQMPPPSAEFVTFRLVDGYSKAQFVKDAEKTNSLIQEFGGLQRSLSVDDNGLWTDYCIWKDHETAMKALEDFPKDPRFTDLVNAIDPTTINIRRAEVELKWIA